MSGDIVFFDLPGRDAGATAKFWQSLFGWEFKAGNFPGYSMIHGPNPMGGSSHGDTSKFPRVYFGVDDLDAATERVRELGGTAGETVTIPSGKFANCVDDQGVEFSIFQAAG
ncbi:VOC family protein [Streptomyces sp. NPDC047315]|uniref:VOC family protein n=1 Tax=Streptomyces sp. NPDC047315 TaxID=3155142 RepID=UPI0033E6157B